MKNETAFRFRAVLPDGTLRRGLLHAAGRRSAAASLARSGWHPVELTPVSSLRPWGRRSTLEDLARGLEALADLLEAGLPVGRALAVVEEIAPAPWRSALPLIRAHVDQGDRLSVALETSGLPLPSHVIAVMAAGEAGSGLAPAVHAAVRLLEERAATRSALRNALAYPILLLVAGGASLGLLVGMVLPRFVELFADLGQSPPLSTRAVLTLGGAMHRGAAPGAVISLSSIVAFHVWVRLEGGRARWHEALLRLPILGPLRGQVASASIASALSALLSAGVPMPAAILAAAPVAGDEAMRNRLFRARERIMNGESFSDAVAREGGLSSTALRLSRVGEESGELGVMLGRASHVDRRQAQANIERLTKQIEPILVLMFGGLILLVALALLQAMYGLQPGL